MADPSIAPLNGACLLFNLPRELRDAIYSFALSEPNGLSFRDEMFQIREAKRILNLHTSTGTVKLTETVLEENQLKHVCRQLYNETVGLGGPCYHLDFVRVKEGMEELSLKKLSMFVNYCSLQKLKRLRKVECRSLPGITTTSNMSRGPAAVSDAIALCATHPNMELVYRLTFDGWQKQPNFFQHGLTYQLTWGGRRIRDFWPELHACWPQDTPVWVFRDVMLKAGELPSNFSVWPPAGDVFDEDGFRKAYGAIHDSVDTLACVEGFKGGMDGMVEEVRSWYEKGILSGK